MSNSNDVKKTINIGIDLINPYKRRGGAKKSIKVKNMSSASKTFKLTSTKRELLNRIKMKRQEDKKKTNALNIVLNTNDGKTITSSNQNTKTKQPENVETFETGFNNALKYLELVRQQQNEKNAKKKQKQRRSTLGQGHLMTVGGNRPHSPAVPSPAVVAPAVVAPAVVAPAVVAPAATDTIIVVNTSTGPNGMHSKPHGGAISTPYPTSSYPTPSYPAPSYPTPLYGNLKGGTLPTYRKYHTLKNNKRFSTGTGEDKPSSFGRPRRLPSKRREVRKKTVKRTYHLGRNKTNNQLSVLIKNQAKNNKIRQEEKIIKEKPIDEVKNYLYDKNMIKIGSTAPVHILRKMYETSILAGEITNKNPKIRLHNFTSFDSIK